MPFSRYLIPLSVCLLAALSSQAQTKPVSVPKPAATQPVEVRLKMPKLVVAIRDYGTILVTKDENQDKLQRLAARRRQGTPETEVVVTVPVSKNWVTERLGIVEPRTDK
ncbi:hypothetical protein [Hymenobacter koreensis]|uniref:Uncharacterized protein n=1 Tax=Hymenobacter koreensis TaxID=1084523 RepID=A0ABP8IUJ5_9BACT